MGDMPGGQSPSTTGAAQANLASASSSAEVDAELVSGIEESFTRQYEEHFGRSANSRTQITSLADARNILRGVEQAAGVKPALIYITFVPQTAPSDEAKGVPSSTQSPPSPTHSDQGRNSETNNSEDQLELVLVTSEGVPIRKRVDEATRKRVIKVANEFRSEVTNVRSGRDYLASGQQLYQWMVAPLEAELKARGIENLAFIMDSGLRSVPIAAFHDGQKFLIEKYSLGLIPSLSLTDTRYNNIQNMHVLAMGATKFSDQKPLPAVPVELSVITSSLWQGKSFLNEAFTLENLKTQRQQQPFGIIHLATHATFQPGAPSNSYIEFWDTKLRLNQMSDLDWHQNPPVELLVLSACRTALGNEQSELGFAGLAVQSGVKSALGSLWFVSDEGTLALMTQLYQQLKLAPIKAEALRQAQLAMMKGQVRIAGDQLVSSGESVTLPPELAKQRGKNFQHPYFWAGFTMIGSPW